MRLRRTSISLFRDARGNPVDVPVLHLESGRRGPHVLLTTLVHGDEVIGLHAALALLDEARRERTFRGRLTIFSGLNSEGFRRSSRFFEAEFLNGGSGTPNLNRSFGAEGSSLTVTIANRLLDEIRTLKPDLAIDCHSYSANSPVHCIIDRPGGAVEKRVRALVARSRVPYYLEYKAKTLTEQRLDFSLSAQLCFAKIDALTIELGPVNGFSLAQGERAVLGLSNLLTSVGAWERPLHDLFAGQALDLPEDEIFVRYPLMYEGDGEGFVRPRAVPGKACRRGDVLADVLNLHGTIVGSVRAPKNGFLLLFHDDAFVYPHCQVGVMIARE